MRDVVIAASNQAAEELAERHLLVLYRDHYRRAGHPLIGGQDPTPTHLAELRRDRFIIGDPKIVVEQIRYFQAHFVMDQLICRLHFPDMPPDVVTQAIRLIGREVMPAFPDPPA